MTKLCKKCNKLLPIDSFGSYMKAGKKRYYQSYCKSCAYKQQRTYIVKDENFRFYHKEYLKQWRSLRAQTAE